MRSVSAVSALAQTLLCFTPIVLATWIGLTRIIDYCQCVRIAHAAFVTCWCQVGHAHLFPCLLACFAYSCLCAFLSVFPGHNFDDVAIGALIGLGVASLTFQLHVSWHWMALHPEEESAVTRLVDGRDTSDMAGPSLQRRSSSTDELAPLATASVRATVASRSAGGDSATGVQLFDGSASSVRRNSVPTYSTYAASSSGTTDSSSDIITASGGSRRNSHGAVPTSSPKPVGEELKSPLLQV